MTAVRDELTTRTTQRMTPVAKPGEPLERDWRNWRWVAREYPGPLLALAALLLWIIGFHPVDPTTLGSFGLIRALNPILVLAYPVLAVAFVVELRRERMRGWALTLITILAVLLVYGLQPLAEPDGRLPVAWLHVGFADYINTHGAVLHDFDARFSWPGFFALLAMITGASGMHDATTLINFAPVVLSGVATLGVRAIAQSVFGPGRSAWLAAWIFLIGNWTEQDYLSPQGSTYLLLLGGLAVTFRFLVRPSVFEPLEPGQFLRPPVPWNGPRDRILAQAFVILLAFALAPSHQLSPFMLAALLFVLVLFGRLWSRWLPVVALLAAVVWFVLGAKDFWLGQLYQITGSIGDLTSSLNQGFAQRLSDNLGRESILVVRIGITLIAGSMAGLGAILLRRRGKRSLTLVAMAVTGFGLAVAQPYGGEVLIRCFLFALPVFALLGAVLLNALLTNEHRTLWLRRLGVGVGAGLVAVLITGVVTARGGNDAYVAFTQSDIAAVQEGYDLVHDGQSLDTIAAYAPMTDWQKVGAVTQDSIEATTCNPWPKPLPCVQKIKPDFLLLNVAQDQYGQIYYGMPDHWIYTLGEQLTSSGLYKRVYVDQGDWLLELTSDVDKK